MALVLFLHQYSIGSVLALSHVKVILLPSVYNCNCLSLNQSIVKAFI